MTSRPSRSSSIPIPRSASASASARNIENLISIPFTSPTRQSNPPVSSGRQPVEPRRVGPEGPRPTASTGYNISVSPVRLTARSVSLVSSVPGRSLSRSTFEPRVIRNSVVDQTSTETECSPQLTTSPAQARRVSASSVRTPGVHPVVVPQHIVSSPSVSFSRPRYLDYSSLRQFLQTEPQAATMPNRQVESSPSASSSRAQSYISSASSISDNDDESMSNVPLSNRVSSSTTTSISQDQMLKLPTRWSEQDRHPHLSVSPDGRELSHNGTSGVGDKEAASIRTNHAMPPACGIYYYEVEIIGKEQKTRISIGFAAKNVKYSRLTGWEANSWGYYGEDGNSLAADKNGSPFGPPFGTGDIIGCGIDFSANVAFYTKNGTLIGNAFENIGRHDLYPSVGLQHNGDSVRTNFGQDPFKFDIDYHVQQQSNITWNKILSTPIDLLRLHEQPRRSNVGSIASITNNPVSKQDEDAKEVLNQLVMSYLVHHGYAKTARAFQKQQKVPFMGPSNSSGTNLSSSPEGGVLSDDIETRTNIVNSVLGGDIDSAIKSIQDKFPIVLEADNHLMLFKLRCRKFVELILDAAEMKKKLKVLEAKGLERHHDVEYTQNTWASEDMDMDIDDDGTALPSESNGQWNTTDSGMDTSNPSFSPRNPVTMYESALNAAILYGQTLANDYRSDPRPGIQQLFKKTFGIVAWEDPLTAGGSTTELVGHDARIALAHEINQAILTSQGRPAQPALETLYCHTSACITQLGLLGVGAAAFVDMQRELLQ